MFLRSQDDDQYGEMARALAGGSIAAAKLPLADRLLLMYAEKLTRYPAAMTDGDIARLHDVGFTDEQVWEATFTVSIFNMFNRMTDAFGLAPPEQAIETLNQY